VFIELLGCVQQKADRHRRQILGSGGIERFLVFVLFMIFMELLIGITESSPRTPGGYCSRGHSSGFFRSNCSPRSNQQAGSSPQHREKVSQKSLSSRCAGAELCDQMEWMLRLPRWRTVDLRKTLQWRSRRRTSCTDLGTKS
jgi:hypothetical protein